MLREKVECRKVQSSREYTICSGAGSANKKYPVLVLQLLYFDPKEKKYGLTSKRKEDGVTQEVVC